MPVILRQFNLTAGQWPNGTDGIVEFDMFDRLPRNVRVRLHRISWWASTPGGGGAVAPAGSWVSFQFALAAAAATRIILLDAEASDPVTSPARFDDSAAVDLCPTIVPRILQANDLHHFRLEVYSSGLVAGAGSLTTLMVDWDLEPYPDSSGRDGAVR